MQNEFRFIDAIRSLAASAPEVLALGIGDDCAVLQKLDGRLLLTVDTMVEGVHFRRDFQTMASVGRKAATAAASDIAAMGGRPLCLLSSLCLPASLEADAALELASGIQEAARRLNLVVAGGNTTRSPGPIMIDTTVVGLAQDADRILTRSGAMDGDLVFVTGELGGAAAGLALLQGTAPPELGMEQVLLDAYREGRARLAEGRILGSCKGVHALIDVSDGLVADLGHLCEESGLDALLEPLAVPVPEVLARFVKPGSRDWLRLVTGGGDDYELLGACAPEASFEVLARLAVTGCRVSFIGSFTARAREKGVVRQWNGEGFPADGWDHFRG